MDPPTGSGFLALVLHWQNGKHIYQLSNLEWVLGSLQTVIPLDPDGLVLLDHTLDPPVPLAHIQHIRGW